MAALERRRGRGESVVAESKMIARAILSEFLCNHVNSVYSALGTLLTYTKSFSSQNHPVREEPALFL